MTGAQMIVDTSAVVAVLKREPGHEAILDALAAPGPHLMAAPTRVELGLVLAATLTPADLDAVLSGWGIEVVAFTPDDAQEAGAAHLRFGRGHHPARLNLGDTFSYALARRHGQALLAVGADFAQTDLAVLPEPIAHPRPAGEAR